MNEGRDFTKFHGLAEDIDEALRGLIDHLHPAVRVVPMLLVQVVHGFFPEIINGQW